MSIEYIGNKSLILDRLWSAMRSHLDKAPKSFADLFSGTASVSAFMRRRGLDVSANDTLMLCTTFAEAALLTEVPPTFQGLANEGIISAPAHQRYSAVVQHLNRLPPVEGFMFRTYSPASRASCGEGRMYFTEKNAAALDAMRQQIGAWKPLLQKAEHALLLVDLVKAANRVSNIAGTYGCYLKRWKPRALEALALRTTDVLLTGPVGRVYRGNANAFAGSVQADIIYADPPYTKRQYAAYYHILETLVAGDEPVVSGSTGLRPWEHASSDYCYRRKAPAALRDLVHKIPNGSHFFLSYNEDGQVDHSKIVDILGDRGRVSFHEFGLRRYKSSRLNHKGHDVVERLYHVRAAA